MEVDDASKELTEARTEEQIRVRQVTHFQPTWSESERGAPGAFTIQLILDQGAEEYVIRPTAGDAEVLLKMLARGANAYFDLDRKVLMFGTQPTGRGARGRRRRRP